MFKSPVEERQIIGEHDPCTTHIASAYLAVQMHAQTTDPLAILVVAYQQVASQVQGS